MLFIAGCPSQKPEQAKASPPEKAEQAKAAKPALPPLTALKVETVTKGTGDGAQNGDLLNMTYTGTLADGTQFDSNDKPDGQPFPLVLGAHQVIAGWEQGLLGIKTGEVRKLSVPPGLGYGSRAVGPIPANSDLYFTVKLLGLVRAKDLFNYESKDKKVGVGPAVKKGDTVTIAYEAYLLNGKSIDSRKRDKPQVLTVGFEASGVSHGILGVDRGILGMRVGGIRRLRLPPALMADRLAQDQRMPRNAIVDWEIELLKIGK